METRVAEAARDRGYKPLSPSPSDPEFDVAWREGGIVRLVEVKSATSENVELQLRLGLGQVLRYAFDLAVKGELVRPCIVCELEPSDQWVRTADAAGVTLVGPKTLARLFG